MAEYYEIKISAEDGQQANLILNSLLDKRLVTGGQLIKAPARFLWKGRVQDMDYVTITSYTTHIHQEAIVADVRENSEEVVPMITFVAIDELNDELRRWIDETLL